MAKLAQLARPAEVDSADSSLAPSSAAFRRGVTHLLLLTPALLLTDLLLQTPLLTLEGSVAVTLGLLLFVILPSPYWEAHVAPRGQRYAALALLLLNAIGMMAALYTALLISRALLDHPLAELFAVSWEACHANIALLITFAALAFGFAWASLDLSGHSPRVPALPWVIAALGFVLLTIVGFQFGLVWGLVLSLFIMQLPVAFLISRVWRFVSSDSPLSNSDRTVDLDQLTALDRLIVGRFGGLLLFSLTLAIAATVGFRFGITTGLIVGVLSWLLLGLILGNWSQLLLSRGEAARALAVIRLQLSHPVQRLRQNRLFLAREIQALSALGQYEESTRRLQTLLPRLGSGVLDQSLRINLAAALINQDHSDCALALLNLPAASWRARLLPLYAVNLSTALIHQERPEQAQALLEGVRERPPFQRAPAVVRAIIKSNLAIALIDSDGDLKRAGALASEALDLVPSRDRVKFEPVWGAVEALSGGDLQRAQRLLADCTQLESAPRRRQLWCALHLGVALKALGNAEGAAIQWRRCEQSGYPRIAARAHDWLFQD